MSAEALNFLVFREGRRMAGGSVLKSTLADQIRLLDSPVLRARVLDALLQAGELECAVADSGVVGSRLTQVTDSMARALVDPTISRIEVASLLEILEGAPVPARVAFSVPEGFAYYALHPLRFAEVLTRFPSLPPRVAVVGIRSIGTTLSAVVAAALLRNGVLAERITVRPSGHPYNRYLVLNAEEMDFVLRGISSNAGFFVVDEGPGLSGSSFLSVGEALRHAGVPAGEITFICSHEPDIDSLRAQNAAQRWKKFQWLAVSPEQHRPANARVWIGGGEWRRYLLPKEEACWPASWLSFEKLKYLSQGPEPRFHKFLGFGRYGDQVFQREEKLAAAGFGASPQMEPEAEGFASYPFIAGRPMRPHDLSKDDLLKKDDLSESVTGRLAAYCAFRARAFALTDAAATVDLAPLQQMVEHNLEQLRFASAPCTFPLELPVVPDARMQPHEWLLTPQGQMLKTDSGGHGDDHFFPGATDIAWDLAGTIVEWRMAPAQAAAFLEMYRRASGDNAQLRIAVYIKAYLAFRCAYCLMAANAMQNAEEQFRMEREAAGYGFSLSRSEARDPYLQR
jgi:hypothetical protein